MITRFAGILTKSQVKSKIIPNVLNYSTKKLEPEIPKNLLEGVYGAQLQGNGKVADKKPFKMVIHAGKTYSWCLCGHSKNQPLCDGTHKNIFLRLKERPIRFKVKQTREYWLCNCKQTANRPFCDGSHLDPEIQEKKVGMNH